jgi:hypothetical protein
MRHDLPSNFPQNEPNTARPRMFQNLPPRTAAHPPLFFPQNEPKPRAADCFKTCRRQSAPKRAKARHTHHFGKTNPPANMPVALPLRMIQPVVVWNLKPGGLAGVVAPVAGLLLIG